MSEYPLLVKMLKERKENENRINAELFQKASEDFEAIKNMIIQDYQPVAIYQWGSLLKKENFNQNSDIDIAVEGVSEPTRFFGMLNKAEAMTSFSLDLIDVKDLHPAYFKLILDYGKKVYAKK